MMHTLRSYMSELYISYGAKTSSFTVTLIKLSDKFVIWTAFRSSTLLRDAQKLMP